MCHTASLSASNATIHLQIMQRLAKLMTTAQEERRVGKVSLAVTLNFNSGGVSEADVVIDPSLCGKIRPIK